MYSRAKMITNTTALHDAVLEVQLADAGRRRRRVVADERVGELINDREERVASEPEEQGSDDHHWQVDDRCSEVLSGLAGDESVDGAVEELHNPCSARRRLHRAQVDERHQEVDPEHP